MFIVYVNVYKHLFSQTLPSAYFFYCQMSCKSVLYICMYMYIPRLTERSLTIVYGNNLKIRNAQLFLKVVHFFSSKAALLNAILESFFHACKPLYLLSPEKTYSVHVHIG